MAALVHESRNALQRSKACLEMLRLELSDRPDVLDLVERAQRAQDDLHRLYEEVRQWAAPLVLRRQPCCLRELWQEAWQQATPPGGAGQVRLEEQVVGPTTCQADRFALIQVFRNIFENALEVSPPGGVVQVRCEKTAVGAAEAVRVAIRDQGPGLTPQQQQRIFDPFFTTKAKGTGLGMAIAQRIVQAHGGSIEARVVGGTEIVVTLPTGAG
jgi:signal transduction histidine kinase